MIKQFTKLILLLISVSTFLNADFLLYMEKKNSRGSVAYCITDYYYKNKRIYFLQSNDNSYDREKLSNYSTINIQAGYIFDENNNCVIANIDTTNYEATNELSMNYYNNFSFLGIPLAYFNSLMALSGILISFIFLYGLVRFI